MQIILNDHNCEGQARQIIFALNRIGLAALTPVQLLLFQDIGLPFNAADEMVWQLCQEQGYLLKSLESTIRRLYTPTILPVLTIGDLNRVLSDRNYCEQCAERLAEIVFDSEILRGVTRLYLP